MNLLEVKPRLEHEFNSRLDKGVKSTAVESKDDLKGKSRCYIQCLAPDDRGYSDDSIMSEYLLPMMQSFASQCNQMCRDGDEIQYLPYDESEDDNCVVLNTSPQLKVYTERKEGVNVQGEIKSGLALVVEAEMGENA